MFFSQGHIFSFIFILGMLAITSCNTEKRNEILYDINKDLYRSNVELKGELRSRPTTEEFLAIEQAFEAHKDLINELSDRLLAETGGFKYTENGLSYQYKDPNNKYRVIHIFAKKGNQAKLNNSLRSFSQIYARRLESLNLHHMLKSPFVEKIDYPELKVLKDRGVSFEGLDMLESIVVLSRLKNESLEAILALKREMAD